MIERWLGQTSQRYRKAEETFNNRIHYVVSENGKLQGEDLQELIESNRELGRWSRFVMRAEVTAGVALIASSKLVRNRSLRWGLVLGGTVLIADAVENTLVSQTIASAVEKAVEGENYLDLDLLLSKANKGRFSGL